MSGALLSAIGATGTVSDVLFGNAGPVVLGEVVFGDMEVPATIPWGGKQHLNIHKLPGGGRVIQAMGRDDRAIRWSGKMYAPDADVRAATLDRMRIEGAPVPLQWGPHLLTVVISDFDPTDRAFGTDYTIACEVLRDETDGMGGSTTLLAQLADDVNQAIRLYASVSTLVATGAAIVGSLQSTQGTIQGIDALAAGDSNAVLVSGQVTASTVAVTAAINSAEAAIGAVNAGAIASLGGYAPTDGGGVPVSDGVGGYVSSGSGAPVVFVNPGLAFGTTDPDAGTAALLGVMAASASQAGGISALGTLGRMALNLGAVNGATDAQAVFNTPAPPLQVIGGSAGRVITTAGGNLFELAATHLGDATQWYRIAQASGLDDPMLVGQVTLTIPDAIQAPSAGVPSPPGVTVL